MIRGGSLFHEQTRAEGERIRKSRDAGRRRERKKKAGR